jgi:hypothetical protein
VLTSPHKFITHVKPAFVQITGTAAGDETKPHINTTDDDTSQFSKTYRASESQSVSEWTAYKYHKWDQKRRKTRHI